MPVTKSGGVAAKKLWYWSSPALDAIVRERVYAEDDARAVDGEIPSSSMFVRRALNAYLAHVLFGGAPEEDVPRDPQDPLTSATLKCYAHVPLALYSVLSTYLRTIPPRTEQGGRWPHSSRKSSVIRQAIRWWIRKNS